MSTLVCFHAHPDDEAIATGGTMAKAAADGHRVVLVVATRGEHGEVVPDVLGDQEALGLRRMAETYAAAEAIGAHRVEFLGYVDSGMAGEPENDTRGSFWSAEVDQAGRRLAAILTEEQTDVLTVYDENGGYGHPDHIQVHRVGVRAAEIAGLDSVFEATINRDHIRRMIAQGVERGDIDVDNPDLPDPDAAESEFGVPETRITHAVDVRDWVDAKRAAMRAHASQIAPDHFFLSIPEEVFRESFGMEWFIARGQAPRGDAEFATEILA